MANCAEREAVIHPEAGQQVIMGIGQGSFGKGRVKNCDFIGCDCDCDRGATNAEGVAGRRRPVMAGGGSAADCSQGIDLGPR